MRDVTTIQGSGSMFKVPASCSYLTIVLFFLCAEKTTELPMKFYNLSLDLIKSFQYCDFFKKMFVTVYIHGFLLK